MLDREFIAEQKNRFILNAALLMLLVMVITAPAAAQSNPICADAESDSGGNGLGVIATLVNSIVQLAYYGGLIGTVATYFGTQAVESAPVGEERRQKMKSLRKRSFGASTKLMIGGPVIFFLLNGVVGLSCISLIPF